MNLRIQELAEQAGYTPLEPRTFADDLQEIFLQKFAELIIQECCDVITPYTIKDGVMFDVSTNLNPIYVLKKHFGVE